MNYKKYQRIKVHKILADSVSDKINSKYSKKDRKKVLRKLTTIKTRNL